MKQQELIFEKRCRGECGITQPIDSFHRDKNKRDGHAGICKACTSVRSHAYYVAHAEDLKAYQKQYRQSHTKEIDERIGRWQAEHPERVAEIKRNWKARNPDYEKTPEALRRKRDARRADRLEAIAAMGGKCECCGLCEPVEFLCFDHIPVLRADGKVKGWGVEHRKQLGKARIVVWLKKHHYPRGNEICPECSEVHQGFRILCYDCNMSVQSSPDGTCAHKETPEETNRKRIESGNPARTHRYQRELRLETRKLVIEAYGGKCSCPHCNQSDARFLSIEHEGRWGREHRNEVTPGTATWTWIRKHEFPKADKPCNFCGEIHGALALLCFNCNLSAGKTGQVGCPHESERLELAA